MASIAALERFPVTITEVVRQAVVKTFTPICGAAPVPIDPNPHDASCDSVVGIISYMGDIPWSLALVLPQQTATVLANKFAGFEIPFDSADMGDVAGEIANVLAGDVVAMLDARRIKAQMSLPVVMRGAKVEMLMPESSPSERVGFMSPQGSFWLRLAASVGQHHIGRRPGT
jgi:chemotaxis protein CheX